MSEQPIHKGQVWRSKDRRDMGRTVTVEEVAASVNEPGNRGFVAVRSVRRSVMRANTLRTRYELVTAYSGGAISADLRAALATDTTTEDS